jgi:hypothetical protein
VTRVEEAVQQWMQVKHPNATGQLKKQLEEAGRDLYLCALLDVETTENCDHLREQLRAARNLYANAQEGLVKLRVENQQLREALLKWSCRKCEGFGETADTFGARPTLCNLCGGTGKDPIAAAALGESQ